MPIFPGHLTTATLAPTLSLMRVVNRAGLAPETCDKLERELPVFGTLQEVVAWGRTQTPMVLLIESIAQDEYTHDVIAPWRPGVVLVFGAT